MSWNKNSDWISLHEAEAQVLFWTGDLAQAEQYLAYVKRFAKYKLQNYAKILSIATADVQTSKKGLAAAQIKLAETKKRESSKPK